MSFRLSSFNFCRAAMGFVCLALAGFARGGEEGVRNIKVVPLSGTAMDTNFNQSSSSDPQLFKAWSPQAPRSIAPQRPNKTLMPPPQTSQQNMEREKELLDRRRNWVFMTPEDYASDGKKDSDADGKDNGLNKKSGTAMERYYQRLYDAEHAAVTNQLGKMNLDRGATNFLSGASRNSDNQIFGDSPFNSTSDSDMIRSVQRGNFADVFGSENRSTLPSPEAVRAEAEQKAHMDSFKQIWNIDQPAVAPAPIASSVSGPVDSGPLFGLSSPGMQPGTPMSFPGGSSSAQTPATPPPNINTSRANSRPPRADFSSPPRPF